MMVLLTRRCLIAAAASAVLSLEQATAQMSGDGPIRIIVPFAAGGSTDLVARLVAAGLSTNLKRPITVENRPGAGVIVGTSIVAKAEPDGTTLLLTTVAHAINPSLQAHLPYDSLSDFVPVAQSATVPLVLSIHPSIPANTLREFLDFVRSNPGQVSYGSAGVGSALHMAAELLKYQAKLNVVHVPYRGAAPAMNDLVSGQIQFIIDPISTSASQIAAGNIRPLAVTSKNRSSTLPNVPTFAEAGMRSYEASTWNVILAPKGTSQDSVRTLNSNLNAALAETALVVRFKQLDVIPISDSTPASTAAFVQRETDRWAAIIRSTGLRIVN